MQRRSIYKIYEDSIGTLVPMMIATLDRAETEYKYEWIMEAFKIARDNKVRNWRYVEAILKRMKADEDIIIMDRYRVSSEGRQHYGEWESK